MAEHPPIEILSFEFDHSIVKKVSKISQSAFDSSENCWQLTLYPNYPTIVLYNKGKNDIEVAISLILRNANGSVAHEQRRGLRHFKAGKSHSFLFLMEWSKIINHPNEIVKIGSSTLLIEAEIHFVRKAEEFLFSPNPFGKNILNLLNTGHLADVSFEVNDTLIHAHRVFLEANAPVLASFCEGSDKNTPIPIFDTSPEVFRHVLRYVYGGSAPRVEVIEKIGIELISAADRFGVVGLKLEVEATFVQYGFISISNVVDVMLFADAKTCPLLKEYSLSYFVARAKDILQLESSSKLKESADLMHELMTLIFCHGDSASDKKECDYNKLSIYELRRKLYKKGLDLDGSKKMLVDRLHEQKILERKCSTV